MNRVEMSVIGVLVLHPEKMERALLKLTWKMFSEVMLSDVFRLMTELHRTDTAWDFTVLVGKLGDGYKEVLFHCANDLDSVSAFDVYVDMVFQAWRVRIMQNELMGFVLNGGDPDETVETLERIVAQQREITKHVCNETARPFKEAMMELFLDAGKKDTSVRTTWSSFNNTFGGLQRGGLYIIAARPGKGKTDFAVQMATAMARDYNVWYLSMEMSTLMICQRIVSRVCRINSARLRDKELTEQEAAQTIEVYERLKDISLTIDDSGTVTVESIRSTVASARPDVLFLDYLGLISGTDARKKNWENTEKVTKGLKAIAKEFNCVIVSLVQLSRAVDKQSKPTLADLRGGSSIEADADGVMFVVPDEIDHFLSGNEAVNMALKVAKNRHGGIQDVNFMWQPQYHCYTEIERRYD